MPVQAPTRPRMGISKLAATEKKMAAQRVSGGSRFKSFIGSNVVVGAKEASERFYKRMLRGAAGAGSGMAAVGGGVGRAASKAWSHEIPNIMLFVFLIGLGFLDIVIKSFFNYNFSISVMVSTVLLVIFGFVVRRIKFYVGFVIAAFLIDTVVAQLPLHVFPNLGIREFLIGIKVFIWLIVAIILFVFEFAQYLEQGKKVPVIAELIIIVLIGIGIFFAYPQMIDIYKHQEKIHADYFDIAEEAIERVEEAFKAQVPAWQEVYFRTSCGIQDPTNVDSCFKQKKAEATCKPFKEKGEEEYQNCIKSELEPRALVEGGLHPSLKEALKIEWKKGEIFEQSELFLVDVPLFSAELKIENPRKYDLNMEISCLFTEGKRNFTGLATSTMGDKFVMSDKTKNIKVTCSPQELLEADKRYKVEFLVKINDLSTESWLPVVFVGGEKTDDDKSEIRRDYAGYGESDSANDLARLNFDLGGEPYIEDEELVIMSASIENTGGGDLVDVKKAEIDLLPSGTESGDLTIFSPCSLLVSETNKLSINQFMITNQKGKKDIYGGLCYLILGKVLKNPDEYVKVVTFEGELIYSYEIKDEFLSPLVKKIGTSS